MPASAPLDATAVRPDVGALVAIPYSQAAAPIATVEGQPVYPLFLAPHVRALPARRLKMSFYGSAPSDGSAGPLLQVAVIASKTKSQHLYLNVDDQPVELTDTATKTLMTITYPGSGVALATVCEGKDLVGKIRQVDLNGAIETHIRHEHGVCPKKPLDVPARAKPDAISHDAPYNVPVLSYVCTMGTSVLPPVSADFTAASKLIPELDNTAKVYTSLKTNMALQCSGDEIALEPYATAPACGKDCPYVKPPVALATPGAPVCPVVSGYSSVAVTFTAPGQTCLVSVTSSNAATTFAANSSNAAIVTATPVPSSQYGAQVTFTAGSAGGTATVNFIATNNGSLADSVDFVVTNQWVGPTPTPLPTPATFSLGNDVANSIVTGPDGALWFTETVYGSNNGFVTRITTNGAMTQYPTTTAGSQPTGITNGPDGALWFTEQMGPKIGRISTSGSITEYSGLTLGQPVGITTGPDGALWFTETSGIGRITTSGSVTEYSIPTATARAVDIAVGPDGNLWFTEYAGGKIGSISTSGTITEYPLPLPSSEPYYIAAGPDKTLWFTERTAPTAAGGTTYVGRITTNGTVTTYPDTEFGNYGGYPIPITQYNGSMWFISCNTLYDASLAGSFAGNGDGFPGGGGMTQGPDGALWVAGAASIGRFMP